MACHYDHVFLLSGHRCPLQVPRRGCVYSLLPKVMGMKTDMNAATRITGVAIQALVVYTGSNRLKRFQLPFPLTFYLKIRLSYPPWENETVA